MFQWNVEVRDRHNVEYMKPAVIVSNHQSALDMIGQYETLLPSYSLFFVLVPICLFNRSACIDFHLGQFLTLSEQGLLLELNKEGNFFADNHWEAGPLSVLLHEFCFTICVDK